MGTPDQQRDHSARLIKLLEETPLSERTAKVLLDTLEQLRRAESLPTAAGSLESRHPVHPLTALPPEARVGYSGVPGAYGHIACETLFGEPRLQNYEEFADVAAALLAGEVDFAVLPVENSSAGPVGEVLELMASGSMYICRATDIKAEHCLCVHPDTDPSTVHTAISHPQALAQCKRFLQERGLKPERHTNTAAAARQVGLAPRPVACICSERGAQLYGLRVLQKGIQDFDENYTRFICVSDKNHLMPGADTISVVLAMPHEQGSLHKVLTRFAACDLDLSRLISMPIASRDFSVRFHLDFTGSIRDPRVENLLASLYDELDFIRFLGNYGKIKL